MNSLSYYQTGRLQKERAQQGHAALSKTAVEQHAAANASHFQPPSSQNAPADPGTPGTEGSHGSTGQFAQDMLWAHHTANNVPMTRGAISWSLSDSGRGGLTMKSGLTASSSVTDLHGAPVQVGHVQDSEMQSPSGVATEEEPVEALIPETAVETSVPTVTLAPAETMSRSSSPGRPNLTVLIPTPPPQQSPEELL